MLRGTAMTERVRDQALAPLECDIPDRWSVDEYRQALALAATTFEGSPRFRRLRALRRSPALATARSAAR
jgi:hypothetical protein